MAGLSGASGRRCGICMCASYPTACLRPLATDRHTHTHHGHVCSCRGLAVCRGQAGQATGAHIECMALAKENRPQSEGGRFAPG